MEFARTGFIVFNGNCRAMHLTITLGKRSVSPRNDLNLGGKLREVFCGAGGHQTRLLDVVSPRHSARALLSIFADKSHTGAELIAISLREGYPVDDTWHLMPVRLTPPSPGNGLEKHQTIIKSSSLTTVAILTASDMHWHFRQFVVLALRR